MTRQPTADDIADALMKRMEARYPKEEYGGARDYEQSMLGIPPTQHVEDHAWIKRTRKDQQMENETKRQEWSKLKTSTIERIGWALLVLAGMGFMNYLRSK